MVGMSWVLGQSRTDGDGRLHASLEWRCVYNNFVPPLSPITCTLGSFICIGYIVVCLSTPQDTRYARPQSSRLRPAAIGERGVVGSGGCEMPLLISSV
jgi:hypothetical protein